MLFADGDDGVDFTNRRPGRPGDVVRVDPAGLLRFGDADTGRRACLGTGRGGGESGSVASYMVHGRRRVRYQGAGRRMKFHAVLPTDGNRGGACRQMVVCGSAGLPDAKINEALML